MAQNFAFQTPQNSFHSHTSKRHKTVSIVSAANCIAMGSFQPLRWSKYVCNAVHGRNLVGDKGAVSPSLFLHGGT